ncbi:MAG: 50S ribosomal protein L11 methyltransferase [Clostridia bacterium]|nr:50S ribosomal protein L11 methyltransferase [Clostridia bacterium]
MKYIEITVHTNTMGSEIISEIMWEYTDQGVAINDMNDVLELDKMKKGTWDYVDEDLIKNFSADVLVKGFVPISEVGKISEIENRIFALKDYFDFPLGSLEVVKREIDGDEWLEKWKENFHPIKIGKNITVVPKWLDYTVSDGETVIWLDSNMAFGTGEHETTYMCVELLEKYVMPNTTVIDVGSGSGILGITASKIGAKKVIMTDIDECATTASLHNVKLNGVSNAEVYLKNLLDDDKTVGDIIVANIMAEVLVGFSYGIGKNIKKDGLVILSGILKTKEDMVKTAYVNAGFTHIETLYKGEWCATVFRNGN